MSFAFCVLGWDLGWKESADGMYRTALRGQIDQAKEATRAAEVSPVSVSLVPNVRAGVDEKNRNEQKISIPDSKRPPKQSDPN